MVTKQPGMHLKKIVYTVFVLFIYSIGPAQEVRLVEKKFGPLDDDTKQQILENKDRDKLDRAIDLILDADSIEEVLSPLK